MTGPIQGGPDLDPASVSGFPDALYHATRLRNLDAILDQGVLSSHFGEVHGAMEYAPAGPSVYMSRHEASGNLNTALFDDGQDAVVILSIDPSKLDPDLVYPDDLLMYLLDEDCLSECDGVDDLTAKTIDDFADRFGLSEEKATRILTLALSAADESGYPEAIREMWPEYLRVEGEISYLGDIPANAITGWRMYSEISDCPEP